MIAYNFKQITSAAASNHRKLDQGHGCMKELLHTYLFFNSTLFYIK